MQTGDYVVDNFGKVTPPGAPAPIAPPRVPLTYSDGSFASVGTPQPQPGSIAPGPAPVVPTIPLASEASSAPALAPTADQTLPPTTGPAVSPTTSTSIAG